jgi:hypothetical protein
MATLDVLEIQKRKLGDRLRDDLTCDTCGAPATLVHLLPGCVDPEEVALTGPCTCRSEQVEEVLEEEFEGEEVVEAPKSPEQMDSGYFFPIHEWAWQFSHESKGDWTMRDQLSEKIRGERAVAMVDQRLRVGAGSTRTD